MSIREAFAILNLLLGLSGLFYLGGVQKSTVHYELDTPIIRIEYKRELNK